MDPRPTGRNRISKRAYEIFEARGRHHGHDLDDWLQAESELNRAHAIAIESPLDSYARALISYAGRGTVSWEDGTSSALNFDAAQFPDGRIVVVGRYERDDAQLWFGGSDESEPVSFIGTHTFGIITWCGSPSAPCWQPLAEWSACCAAPSRGLRAGIVRAGMDRDSGARS